MDQETQVDQENNPTALNCSKLTEAQSLLRALDTTSAINESKVEKKMEEGVPKPEKKADNSKQITN